MTPLPILDGRLLHGPAGRRRFASQFADACRRAGTFYLAHPPVTPGRCARVLEAARAFFALPAEDKADVHIRRSAHFRGYSEMHNERDWREQIHFGPELPALSTAAGGPAYLRLQGPNLWPARLGEGWKETLLGYLDEAGALGRLLLEALALSLELPEDRFLPPAQAYLLLKLINYHPQPARQPGRPGVAPHCDWSWLTILLQNDVGGLQVRCQDGDWVDVPPLAGTLVVNLGELSEAATAGVLEATPHRVLNHSARQPRVSVPVFINPGLPAVVSPVLPVRQGAAEGQVATGRDRGGHVHRVLAPGRRPGPFVFGESEWARKGLGQWCHDPDCREK